MSEQIIRKAFKINKQLWKKTLCEFIRLHGRLVNDSEVCWALWLARELHVYVNKQCIDLVWIRCGPLPLMLLFDCLERGIVRSRPDEDQLIERLGGGPFSRSFWILTYEAVRRNWLTRPALMQAARHDIIDKMLREDVSFYNQDALPRVLEGRDEIQWKEVVEAIGDVGGGYDDDVDDEFAEDDTEFWK